MTSGEYRPINLRRHISVLVAETLHKLLPDKLWGTLWQIFSLTRWGLIICCLRVFIILLLDVLQLLRSLELALNLSLLLLNHLLGLSLLECKLPRRCSYSFDDDLWFLIDRQGFPLLILSLMFFHIARGEEFYSWR